MKRSRILHLFCCLAIITVLIAALLPDSVLANTASQTSIEITKDDVEMKYPDGVTFHLHATADSKIKEATLIYGIEQQACQEQISRQPVKITADQQIEAEWEWKFSQSGPVPPGASFWWQWEITTEAGENLHTEVLTATITDQRNPWQTLSKNGITVQWYQGDRWFGTEMLNIAVEGLERLEREMGVRPDGEIWLTIFPSSEEVVEALIVAPEWAGGVAFPEYSSIIIGVPPSDRSYAYSVIPHELAHLVVGKLTFNCQGIQLPTWLDEGLAVYAEGPISTGDRSAVIKALARDTLPELVTLRSGFSSFSESARLAYAESGVIVEFLAKTYGADELSALLAEFRNGKKDDAALTAVYGFDTAGLDRVWRTSMGYTLPTLTPTSASGEVKRPTRTPVPTLALFTSIVQTTTAPSPTPSITSTRTPIFVSSHTPAAVAGLLTEPAPGTAIVGTNVKSEPGPARYTLLLVFAGVCGIFLLMLAGVAFILIRKRS